MSNTVPTSSALRALALEYKSLQEEPVEGFRVKLLGEDNLFEWEVAIFGPPDTLYQGGYFKAHMKFPPDYPYSPPSIRFLTKVWHPNVYEVLTALFFYATGSYQRPVGVAKNVSQKMCSAYIEEVTKALIHRNMINKYIRFPDTLSARQAISQRFYTKYMIPGVIGCIDCSHFKIYGPPKAEEHLYYCRKHYHSMNVQMNGDLCISILHPPIDDPQSGELPCERWNPTQSVRTVLLSVISLLNEPNTFSPANVDASVMYRRWRDSKGKDKEYENIIRKQAQVARMEAEKEGIVVPLTLEDYCIKTQVKSTTQEPQLDMTDFYDDDYDDLDTDSEEEVDGGDGDGDDSGNGES